MEVPDSGVSVRTFSEEFTGCEVNFQVLKLKESFLVWIGSDRSFKNLAVAMKTRFVSILSALPLKTFSLVNRIHYQWAQSCWVM